MEALEQHGLRYFPIGLFASVMGFAGVTIASRHLEELLNFPHYVSLVFLFFSTLLFLVNLAMLSYRSIHFLQDVREDFNHPVKMNFFAAISISLLLLAESYYHYVPALSFVVWVVGAVLQLYLTLKVLSNLIWRQSFVIAQFNPAWFIPIVGNIVVPLAGVYHVGKDINWLFFSIGIVFSIIYLTIMMQRLFFDPSLPNPLMATLFILMAPPAVGFLSYMKLTGNLNVFAHILFGFAFFIFLLLLFNIKRFIVLPFFVSWWAFLFPTAALTIATIHMFVVTKSILYAWSLVFESAGLLFLIIVLSWKTVKLAVNKKLCVSQ